MFFYASSFCDVVSSSGVAMDKRCTLSDGTLSNKMREYVATYFQVSGVVLASLYDNSLILKGGVCVNDDWL